jgi:hypothetical protein
MGEKRARVEVTNSELGSFRSCRKRWWFQYEEKLRPKVKPRALAVGSIVHSGLAAMYKRIFENQVNSEFGKATPIDSDELCERSLKAMQDKLSDFLVVLYDLIADETHQDKIDAMVEESKLMEQQAESCVVRFVERFAEEDQRRFAIVGVELPFSVPLLDQNGTRRSLLTYGGVMDALMFDYDVRDLVLGEHKTTSQDAMALEQRLDLDPQTTGYIYSAEQLLVNNKLKHPHVALLPKDVACNRIMYNVVRKKGPSKPKMNKPDKYGGRMVSSAPVDTLREYYENALIAQEGQGPKYKRTEKQITRLESCYDSSRYVARHEAWHSTDMIETWRDETHEDAKLVRDAKAGRLPLSRNVAVCDGPWNPPCRYRSICVQDSPERRAEFLVSDERHAEVAEALEESELDAKAGF